MDLTKGSYQMRITEGDEPKTISIARYGPYECLVTPFVSTNAQIDFSRDEKTLSHLLGPVRGGVLGYIVIYSKTLKEHVEYLKRVPKYYGRTNSMSSG